MPGILSKRRPARSAAVRILFLDRDGTLNRSLGRRPPNTPEEVELLPGVSRVLSRYAAEGWLLVIVTNQGGVASGYISEAAAHAVQQQAIDLLPVPVMASYLCPHMPGGVVAEYAIECPNRKPQPGFILAALEELGARAEDCLFVGDSITDKEAAEAAGVAFSWADLFFQRRIDRGLQTVDGRWVQVREPLAEDGPALDRLSGSRLSVGPELEERGGDLILVAVMRGVYVGWLSLVRGETRAEADLSFDVEAAYHDLGLGSLLLDTALGWANAQGELRRLCVEVRADNLPVSRLCCQFGFAEEGQAARGRITLACDL